MKIKPFIERLNAAKLELMKAIQSGNRTEIIRGIEDVGFWTGRSIAELISASEAGLENPSLFRQGFASLYAAQEVLMFGKKYLMGEPLPSEWGNPPSTGERPNPPPSQTFSKWGWVKEHKRPLFLATGLVGGPMLVGMAKNAKVKNMFLMQSTGAIITLASLYYMTRNHAYRLPD
jgi:hypothetical protein